MSSRCVLTVIGIAIGTILQAHFIEAASSCRIPLAHLKNGTYRGYHDPSNDQDYFLGVPFAQAPVKDLRFANPVSLNTTWTGIRDAVKPGHQCPVYGGRRYADQAEDCLVLDIYRPATRTPHRVRLPVYVYIHGGAFITSGVSDGRWNLTYSVGHSVELGTPVIGVSIAYRLGGLGFLNSPQLLRDGQSNQGVRDQRLALHWIRENIAAFGGDPDRVTIVGESAGGAAVGIQLIAYNGRDDKLFRGAMMQSGNPLFYGSQKSIASQQASYTEFTKALNCSSPNIDSLACLRKVDLATLNSVLNTAKFASAWGPQIDGDIIARHASKQMADGDFVHVPIIIGNTNDEGTSYGSHDINTTAGWAAQIATLAADGHVFPQDTINNITQRLYTPANLAAESNVILPFQAPDYMSPYGPLFRAMSTFMGDAYFIAHRRTTCETWARNGLRVWCYRFNAIPAISDAHLGATHFMDVPFTFLNLEGQGHVPVEPNPFQDRGEEYKDLARLMNGDWVTFVATGDPNGWRGREDSAKTLGVKLEPWPLYSLAPGKVPQTYAFVANLTSGPEDDDYRKEGMELISSLIYDVFDR